VLLTVEDSSLKYGEFQADLGFIQFSGTDNFLPFVANYNFHSILYAGEFWKSLMLW
jgi:hypothetical protein